MAARRDIILIGGSAGSGSVLRQVIGALPKDLPAALFITTHIPSGHENYLREILARQSALDVTRALDGQPIEPGRAYVACEDRHLLLVDGAVRLGSGPRENLTRPAIDPMFRSAALSYGSRAVGIVLSGLLNDGAAGLAAIKEVGGTAVVQHPLDAAAADMPRAALEVVRADHVVPASELAALIEHLAREEAGPARPPGRELLMEVEVAAGARLGSDILRELADPAPLTCPHCAGVLSEVRDGRPLRYRCQVGHAFTAETLVTQTARVHKAIRVAMRVIEERLELVTRMARDAREAGRIVVAELYEARATEYARYARTLREAAIDTLPADLHDEADPPG